LIPFFKGDYLIQIKAAAESNLCVKNSLGGFNYEMEAEYEFGKVLRVIFESVVSK